MEDVFLLHSQFLQNLLELRISKTWINCHFCLELINRLKRVNKGGGGGAGAGFCVWGFWWCFFFVFFLNAPAFWSMDLTLLRLPCVILHFLLQSSVTKATAFVCYCGDKTRDPTPHRPGAACQVVDFLRRSWEKSCYQAEVFPVNCFSR